MKAAWHASRRAACSPRRRWTAVRGTATPVATVPSRINTIQVAGGQNSINNNFGEIVASSIAGKVFLDSNNSGTLQTGEAGIAGVPITLTGIDDLGNPIGPGGAGITVNTLADGSYVFPNLRPSGAGGYTITEGPQPTGTSNGITTAGTAGGTATSPTTLVNPPTQTSRISSVTLPPNTKSTANNFAEIPTDRTLAGRVFVDANNDKIVNTIDTGVGALTVTLSGADANGNPVNRTVPTNADGTYSFVLEKVLIQLFEMENFFIPTANVVADH